MQITTFLMFAGAAEEAVNFYVAQFPRSRIVSLKRYGPNEAGPEGTVERVVFELCSTRFMAIDSPVQHAFTFTPAISLFVDCDTQDEIDRAIDALSRDGLVLMPAGAYGFSRWFAWVQDKYGVSWQLNLP